MFTGIVEAAVAVRSWAPSRSGGRLVLSGPPIADWSPREGQSVAVSGACLTVVEAGPEGTTAYDLSQETLERTWFRDLAPGRRVNLERALCLGDRLDGHLVSGHVDGLGRLLANEDAGDGGRELTFEVDPALARYLVPKGSVTLDGISLTVIEPGGARFRVAVIPTTLERTALADAHVGDRVNVEVDLIGKWIERLVGAR